MRIIRVNNGRKETPIAVRGLGCRARATKSNRHGSTRQKTAAWKLTEPWRKFGFKKKPAGWLGRGGVERKGIKSSDGRHYWLTPPELMRAFKKEFRITFDACPYPRPKGFCGLEKNWGKSTYVNPPFYGPTAWVRKAIHENKKGKTVVFVFPTDKWIHYLLKAGAEMRSLGDVKWCAIEDGKPGKGIGRYTMAFILRGKPKRRRK